MLRFQLRSLGVLALLHDGLDACKEYLSLHRLFLFVFGSAAKFADFAKFLQILMGSLSAVSKLRTIRAKRSASLLQ